jgi:hypothetical protein
MQVQGLKQKLECSKNTIVENINFILNNELETRLDEPQLKERLKMVNAESELIKKTFNEYCSAIIENSKN